MTFDKILDNNTLWAVRYDGAADNALQMLFERWSDPEWLVDFFLANMADLKSFFKITDINQAIYDTIDDSQRIQCLILDISPDADLDKYVAGMVVKQCIEGLDQEDTKEILDKINSDEEENSDSMPQDGMEQEPDMGGQPDGGQPQGDMPPMNESTTPYVIDEPENTHYAVNKSTNLIVNAWQYDPEEYEQDMLKQYANDYFFDDLRDYGFNPKEYTILTRKGLAKKKIDPSRNESWSNDGKTPCKSGEPVNESVSQRQAISSRYEEFMSDDNGNNSKVPNRNSYNKRPWTGKTFKG
jgi:hypothetical protein